MGLTLNHVVTVSQFATMLGFVRAGIGLAIAPRSGVASFLGKELSAVPIRGRPLPRDLGFITLKERSVVRCGHWPDVAHQGILEQDRP